VTIAFALAVYFVIWWVVLFAVLPFGVRTQHEAGHVVPGTPASAPVRPKFLQIVLATSLIAGVIFGIAYAAFAYGLIDLRPPLPQPG
jgi:predicted secreted protein